MTGSTRRACHASASWAVPTGMDSIKPTQRRAVSRGAHLAEFNPATPSTPAHPAYTPGRTGPRSSPSSCGLTREQVTTTLDSSPGARWRSSSTMASRQPSPSAWHRCPGIKPSRSPVSAPTDAKTLAASRLLAAVGPVARHLAVDALAASLTTPQRDNVLGAYYIFRRRLPGLLSDDEPLSLSDPRSLAAGNGGGLLFA